MRADKKLQKAVLKQLECESCINSSHIGVSARDGVVTLSGRVSSIGERTAAERIAAQVAGVKAVVDEIAVDLSGMRQLSDEVVAEKAATELAPNMSVPLDRLHLGVTDELPTLRGDVDWQYQREAAVSDLRRHDCIREVRDEVRINSSAHADEVQKKMHDALARIIAWRYR